MNNGSLLLVDDDRHLRESMAAWLVEQGYQVQAADGCQQAIAKLRETSFDLVLS